MAGRSRRRLGNAAPSKTGGAEHRQHGSRQDARPGPEPSERGGDQRAPGAFPPPRPGAGAPAGEEER